MTPAKLAMLAALKAAYGGEVLFRPSAATRWMTCPGSVQLIAQIPKTVRNKAGPAAREGSGAHALAEIVFNSYAAPTGRIAPESYVGRTVAINGARADDLTSDPEDFVIVDAEMAEKIAEFEAVVKGYLVTPHTEMFIERRLTLAHLDPANPLYAECSGTGDIILVNRVFGWLVVLDLKYGKGVAVSRNTPQLKIYALKGLLEFHTPARPWAWIGTTVFQPRLPYPQYSEDDWIKPFQYEPRELLNDFLPDVVQAMEAALEPDPVFNPSDNACRWCPAARIPGMCKALMHKALAITRDADAQRLADAQQLEILPDFILPEPGQPAPPAQDNVVVLPQASELSPEELGRIHQGAPMLLRWLADVDHQIVRLSEVGVKVPGCGIKRRSGHRRFTKPEAEIAAVLQAEGLARDKLFQPAKLRSPTQIEKLLPAKKKYLMQPGSGLVEKPQGEYQLVSDDSSELVSFEQEPVEMEILDIS